MTLEVPGVLLCDEGDDQAGAGLRHFHAVPPVVGERTLAQEEEGVSSLPADDLRAELVHRAGQPGRVAEVHAHHSLVIAKLRLAQISVSVHVDSVVITVAIVVLIFAVVILVDVLVFIISLFVGIIVIVS